MRCRPSSRFHLPRSWQPGRTGCQGKRCGDHGAGPECWAHAVDSAAGHPPEHAVRRWGAADAGGLAGLSPPDAACQVQWADRRAASPARRSVAGEDAGFLYSSEADPDGEFDHVDTADAEQDFATYLREIDLARQAAAGRELDETFFHPRRRARLSVRWVYVHMLEEYARHNGHADLLRERIDGATGL